MKKIFCTIFVILIVCTLCFACSACDNKSADNKLNIVYLGDSIAEALIGPSPVGERDNYGYYAIVGKCNEFNYYNHSVSGHKTSGGMAGQEGLLEMISRESENATLMKTHIQQADILHISVLGNNVLQYDLGLLLVECAYPDFEEKYANGETLINALHDGGVMSRPTLKDGGASQTTFDFPATYQNICDIVAKLKELNPTAQIIFQKVYNPVYEGTSLLYDEAIEALSNITDDGRFGCAGQPITTIAQIRKVAQVILDHLNGVLDEYLAQHPGAFEILDVNKAFEDVTQSGVVDGKVDLSDGSIGSKLLFNDWTHPSNFGHAVIACATQDLLSTLGLASDNALANYKASRKDLIDRLFASIEGFDASTAKSAIDDKTSFYDVTLAYFNAIDGYVPVYC